MMNSTTMTQSKDNYLYNKYKETAIYTSSPGKLIILLYDGLIKFIMKGIKAINEKNIPEANTNIIKAQNIVSELSDVLDMKYEISISLRSIYKYMLNRLIKANVLKSKEILEETLNFANTLRDTWTKIVK